MRFRKLSRNNYRISTANRDTKSIYRLVLGIGLLNGDPADELIYCQTLDWPDLDWRL